MGRKCKACICVFCFLSSAYTQTMQGSTLLYTLYFLHCFVKPNYNIILLEYQLSNSIHTVMPNI